MVSLSLRYLSLWTSATFAQRCKQKSAPSDTVLNPLHSSTPVPQCYLKHSGALHQTPATGYLLVCVCVHMCACARVWLLEHSNHEQRATHRKSSTKPCGSHFMWMKRTSSYIYSFLCEEHTLLCAGALALWRRALLQVFYLHVKTQTATKLHLNHPNAKGLQLFPMHLP